MSYHDLFFIYLRKLNNENNFKARKNSTNSSQRA